ncbi:cupin domain-containing protein [Halorientalis salina]|uniref:cupin domain-containing protein n=1 Tax=Halorientalis salina TaxID=2932266 RepID=UPI0010AC8A86|nr:cupin domain-containing protein [Halorientalis salina]
MDSMPLAASETVEVVDGVHLTQLVAGERMSVQHFHIEPGATVPEHSHEHEQVGFVYRGTMVFEVGEASEDASGNRTQSGGDEYVIGPNESFGIPSEEPHAAVNRGDEPVRGLDVFAPPRPNPDWEE